jgi:glutamyl-tRNA synthetase
MINILTIDKFMEVRVRFAPSPTGYLHVGGLRTALYNFLFARHHNGQCILRIEDTDRTRLVENATENLISSLSWAGVEFDESPVKGGDFGPYIQSERLDIYKEHAKLLIESGSAYYAFDTPEEIEAMRSRLAQAKLDPKYDRMNMKNSFTLDKSKVDELIASGTPFVIRLKVPDEEVQFSDIIRGEIAVHGRDVDDQVLMKSDGFPTYHLANVVDDYLMKITHVIRGEEWLPSTPKHILLYDAFGWQKPQFAHLPLLLNKDKSKLSKRQGDVAVEDYIRKGYFKETVVNFVALLGWNPSGDREIYNMNELIESFNLEKVNKAGAVFDIQKLEWMNGMYLRAMDEKYLLEELKSILIASDISESFDDEYLSKVIHLFRERVTFVHEIPHVADYMFAKPGQYEEDYMNKYWKPEVRPHIEGLFEMLNSTENFNHDALYPASKEYAESRGIKLKDIIHPLRLMITGKSAGAGMFETMEALGKEECISRISFFLNKY